MNWNSGCKKVINLWHQISYSVFKGAHLCNWTFSYRYWFFKRMKKATSRFSGLLRRNVLGYWTKDLGHLIKVQIMATRHSPWPTVSCSGEEGTALRVSHMTTEWLLLYFRRDQHFRAWRAAATRPAFPSGHVQSNPQYRPCYSIDVYQKGSQHAKIVLRNS